MAVIKSLPGTKSLKQQLIYLQKEGKTYDHLKKGINCTVDNVLMEFNLIKEIYNKPTGKGYYHYTQAFSPNDNISPERANELGEKWITSIIKGHQIYMVTHIDKDHIHNHFIINSVNMENGLKLQISPKKLYEMKVKSNEICIKEGLATINLDRNSGISKTHNEYNLERRHRLKGEPIKMWKDKVRNNINKSVINSNSFEEFKRNLKNEHNILVEERETDLLYIYLENSRKVKGKRLGGDYRKEAIKKQYEY